MKTYLLPLIILFTGCLGLPAQPPATNIISPVSLKLTTDSGYLHKKDILDFLQTNDLADTLNTWWKQWQPNDTLGKYYKTADNDFLLCVLSSDNEGNLETNKLIAIDKNGKYISSHDFTCDRCDDVNKRTEALQKKGNYFLTYSCGSGPSFSSSWICLFRRLSERNDGNQLLEYVSSGVPACQEVKSAWYIKGDSCIMNYTIQKGSLTEEGCKMRQPSKTTITYRYNNGKWAATDSSKLKQIDFSAM